MLNHLSDMIISTAKTHELLAYVLAFVLTGAEAFPVIGALVPGTAIVVGLGALVPTGALHFWPLVAWSTGGAILETIRKCGVIRPRRGELRHLRCR